MNMSSNQKHPSTNGIIFSNQPKKARESLYGWANGCNWRRAALLPWYIVFFLGLVFFITSLNFQTLVTSKDRTRVLSDNCSGEKVASFGCGQDSGSLKLLSCVKACALHGLGSGKHMFDKKCGSVIDKVEFNSLCIERDNINPNYPASTSLEHVPVSLDSVSTLSYEHICCEKNEVKKENRTDCCENIYFLFAKLCLWILVGMAISHNIPRIPDMFSRFKHETPQQQPLIQQPPDLCSSRNTGKWREKLLVVFVFGGILTSVWLFWYFNKDIVLRRKETLASMCDERARMLQDQFNVSMNHVHALAILVSTFHHGKHPSAIDQKTFEDYTERTAFERPLTSGVAYALRVRHSERENIEKQYGWTIKKMETEDQALAEDYNPETFSTSPVQDEYAPVIFSQKTVSHIVSIDMMSGKEDRENILRARASGKGVLTSPFKLLKSNHLGVVLTFAVYCTHLPPDAMPELRINATVGYLGASYDIPSLVKKLLHQLASKQTIIVNVFDTTTKSAPINMYGTDVADKGLLHVSNLDFGDPTRKHEMHCRFKQKPPLPWQAITLSVGVLVITLLLGHIFHAAINRIAKVERDCREMMELKHRAEAADVAKSQFLATVSHEIRTPMNGVLGMLQMLMDTNLDPIQLDYAETAHASGKDLISLINKVLDQAKIESGRLELEAVPFDIRAVLDKLLSIFSGKSHEKGIELAVYVSNQVPEVVIGDQERFGQIITNLVGNSIKFTHYKGHIFVSVHLVDEVRIPFDSKDEILRQSLNIVEDTLNASCNTLSGFQVVNRWKIWESFKTLDSTAEDSGNIRLLVTVEDTGAGIPPEAKSRIFTPFMQADSSTSRKYGGTGIGLSISKRLVNLMGGEIGFCSELNVGSTFSFTVNLTKVEANSLDTMWQLCNPPVSEFRGLRALVIDERRIRAEITQYHLQRLGLSVDIASTIEPCNFKTSVAESERFAMVLIDQEIWHKEVSAPTNDLINMITESKSVGSMKIFLLSTGKNSSESSNFKLHGLVDDLITKPLRLSALTSSFLASTGKKQDPNGKASLLKNLLKDKQILVVDDNSVNRRVAEGALKKYGAVVICVEGGQFAIELLKPPHKFDACLMDIQMPQMDGFEATRQIRYLESEFDEFVNSNGTKADETGDLSSWHTPILAMTADVSQATKEACIKCGMDDYVPKPFREGELYSAVARFLDIEDDFEGFATI